MKYKVEKVKSDFILIPDGVNKWEIKVMLHGAAPFEPTEYTGLVFSKTMPTKEEFNEDIWKNLPEGASSFRLISIKQVK